MKKSWFVGLAVLVAVGLGGCAKPEQEPEAQTEYKALYNSVNAPLEQAKGVDE